jgi:uncharacterized protein YydD (DUF2326 family)
MRLIALTANQDSFHPIIFNKSGLTLIIGSQKITEEDSHKRTYNGVGKSLITAIIHYCLGSARVKGFENNLGGWEFQLKFSNEEEEYTATRSIDEPNKIILSGEELNLKEFNNKLQEMVFPETKNYKGLSFRELFKIFIRRNRLAYTTFDSADYTNETPYKKQLRLACLLGLNVDLAIEKFHLRKRIEELQTKQNQFEKDQLFKTFLEGNSNPDIELHELATNIKRLEIRLKNYLVAEDYHVKQREANDVTYSLQQLRNKQELISKALLQIIESMQIKSDITPDKIYKLYEEVNAALPEIVKNKIGKVSDFYKKLLLVRAQKLAREKKRLNDVMKSLSEKIDELNKKRDSLLQYIGAHGALDEYTALSNQLGEMKGKVQKLKDFQELLRGYSDAKAKAEMELKRSDVETNQYLIDIRKIIESNMEAFTTFSGRFYEEKPGGLAVKNNEGENQVRFDIEAKIQDDASDGINEVKIFCFDMTVLTQKHNHAMDFLFHDSRLFSDMDYRQRAIALEVALEVSTQGNYQYIATINQDQLEMASRQWGSKIKKAIEDSVVLELTDAGPESKLLGIQVNMEYEE